jgi:hypothetical protein
MPHENLLQKNNRWLFGILLFLEMEIRRAKPAFKF